jgi:anhydro-N-acetylmuramic acid kinase
MNRNSKYFTPLRILGIMSGTSLDGLDLALCDFWKNEHTFHYNILQTKTFPYPNTFSQKLRELFDSSALDFCHTEVEFSNFTAQCINDFLAKTEKKPDYLASHGHTVFHQPEKGLTKQIGNGAILAAKTGISTICDFRTIDVALGGQGAPLVPIGDALLFPEYDGCLNLGGIANVSYGNINNRIAYDISLCNILLNYLAKQSGFDYDKNGELAQHGNVDLSLLDELNKPDYFSQTGAKSIGFESFINYYKPLLESFSISIEDKLRTVCEHISIQIAQNIKTLQKILVTGGGAKNRFLIDLIQEKANVQIVIPDEQWVDFKEALVFAFLGYLRVHEENNCLQSVTGATKNCCGGSVYI